MASLSASVGRGARNVPSDVKLVQELLNGHMHKLAPLGPLVADSKAGNATFRAIEAFQSKMLGMQRPDGRIDPGGRTFKALLDTSSRPQVQGLPNQGRVSDRPPLDIDVQAFFGALDKQPDLKGVRVVYFDGARMHVLREGPPYCGMGQQAVVIREGIEEPALVDPTVAQTRDGKLLSELLNMGLSCGSAALAWSVIGTAAGAVPITGGASSFIVTLGTGAAWAAGAQCVVAGGRVLFEWQASDTLDVVDSNVWYQRAALALDAISLAGAVTATATTIRLALKLRATTGKSMVQVLKGLSRQERKRLAEEAIRIERPGISNGQLKDLVRAGMFPKRFTPLEVSTTVRNQLKDAASAALTLSGSAYAGAVRQGGELVFGIASAVETY